MGIVPWIEPRGWHVPVVQAAGRTRRRGHRAAGSGRERRARAGQCLQLVADGQRASCASTSRRRSTTASSPCCAGRSGRPTSPGSGWEGNPSPKHDPSAFRGVERVNEISARSGLRREAVITGASLAGRRFAGRRTAMTTADFERLQHRFVRYTRHAAQGSRCQGLHSPPLRIARAARPRSLRRGVLARAEYEGSPPDDGACSNIARRLKRAEVDLPLAATGLLLAIKFPLQLAHEHLAALSRDRIDMMRGPGTQAFSAPVRAIRRAYLASVGCWHGQIAK